MQIWKPCSIELGATHAKGIEIGRHTKTVLALQQDGLLKELGDCFSMQRLLRYENPTLAPHRRFRLACELRPRPVSHLLSER